MKKQILSNTALLVALAAVINLNGCSHSAPGKPETTQETMSPTIEVDAPNTKVDLGENGIKVVAPGVDVKVGDDGVQVDAPGTRVDLGGDK